MSEAGAIGGDACQSANPMTKQVSAEDELIEKWTEELAYLDSIELTECGESSRYQLNKQLTELKAALDKSRATLPSAGGSDENLREAIERICPKCGHDTTVDGCANCLNHELQNRGARPTICTRKHRCAEQGEGSCNGYPRGAAEGTLHDIPSVMLTMAHQINQWAILHGWKDWEIGPIADRKLVASLWARIEEVERRALKLYSDWQKSVTREADLTAALEQVLEIVRPPKECPFCPAGDACSTCRHLAELQGQIHFAALAIKPASALTATKEAAK